MYGEWNGVCDFVVLSVVEVCVDYGVGVCVNVCGVVCVVVWFLRLRVICCVVVGCVPLCVVCVFRRVFVSVEHPVAILSVVFCVICSLLMFVSDTIGDHMVEAYSSMSLVTVLYVARIISFVFPMLFM